MIIQERRIVLEILFNHVELIDEEYISVILKFLSATECQRLIT